MHKSKIHFHKLIREKDWAKLKHELTPLEPLEIAAIMEKLSRNNDVIFFCLLSREKAKDTFQHLSHHKQEEIIKGLAKNVSKLSGLLNDLDPDDRTAFFEELPGKVTQRLIYLLSPEERKIATKLLGFPENSIGRLMTPEFVALKPNFSVAKALQHIREYGRDSETLNVVYVVDKDWKLIDDIKLKEILLAQPGQTIKELMDNQFVALNAYDDQELAVRTFKDHDRVALPVTDKDGVLMGIVTVDDMMDVAEEETTEDFHKFGAFQEAIVNPLKATIASLYKKRVLWLSLLVFMNVFSGAAIARFENVIESMVFLLFFLPLLIASGGNAGAQSATLMIRSLAIGDVQLKDWGRLVGREVIVALMLGLTMALCVGLIANFRSPEATVVVTLSMTLTVMIGSLIGLLLPFVFTRFKIDPATASAPLVTSLADISGVVIYFSIAAWYFGV